MGRPHDLFALAASLVGCVWFFLSLSQIATPPVAPLLFFHPRTTAFMRADPEPPQDLRWKPLTAISRNLQHAVIAAEDDLFFSHNGLDLEAMQKAARTNWKRKRFSKGASTITMQLSRNLYLSREKTLIRKAHEILIALKLDRMLSKQRILEIYLNVAEWGNGIYGAEAAAQHYFHKSAGALGPGEAAFLAAILTRPKYYDRRRNTPFLRHRINAIERRI